MRLAGDANLLGAGYGQIDKVEKSTTETTVNFEYDNLYHIKKHDYPSGTDLEFEHDAAGRRTKMKNGVTEKRYSYDDADRMTKILEGPPGFVENTGHRSKVEFTWNAASQRTEKKVTLRTQLAVTTGNTYTDDGYIDVVTDNDGAQTKHEYLTDGRVKKITLKFDTSNKKSTRELFYQDTNDSHAYVANKNKHLRQTLDKKQGGTIICSASYELDAAGIRLSMTDKDGGYFKWGYDPMYQLKAEHKWASKGSATRNWYLDWVYDPTGNRLSQFRNGVLTPYTFGQNNEMLTAGSTDFTFDHFGNLSSFDDGTEVTNLTYDIERHMTHITTTDTITFDEHEYDGDGRRMRSKLNLSMTWRNFIHDELTDEILCEYEISGGVPTIKALFTWGIGLISTTFLTTKRWYHFDGLGNTLALTDYDETVTDTYQWSAFGKLEASTGSSTNPFRYVGQWGYYDDGARGSQFGLLLLGVRYYSPTWGRFLVWDPVAASNRYLYTDNEPITRTDPTGLAWYGKYCGPQKVSGIGKPIDEVDACCCAHDNCWSVHKCTLFNQSFYRDCALCTDLLCDCLKEAKCSTPECRRFRKLAMKHYACVLDKDLVFIARNLYWPDCHGNRFHFRCDKKGRVIG